MASGTIQFMSEPVTATSAVDQELRLVVPAGDYHEFDLVVRVLNGTNAVIKIKTGMTNESEDGWITMSPVFSALSSGGAEQKTFTNPLKYIRWRLDSGGTATFLIQGIGRTF